MKTVYSTPTCVACKELKAKYDAQGIAYKEVMIGRDISKEDFFSKYPSVRSVPYVVENDDDQ